MAYNRINWENAPSTATPLDADNLNRMDAKIADLDTSMDAVQESYDEMSNEMDLVNARIDTFINLPDGSTTGDAELADARLGADGVTYNTLGQAVRTQFTNLNNKTTTDTAPTYGSTKPVQSGGTYTAIQDVIAKFAPAFSESATYSIGDYCTYDDKIYRAKAAITSGNDFVSGYWTELSSISVIIKEMRNIVTDTEVVIGSSYPAGTFLVYDGVLYEAISDNAPFNPSGGDGSAGWRGVRLDDIIARTNANFADQYTRKTYSAGDYCVQMGVLYRANTDISTAEAFTANHWDQVSVTEVLGGLDVAVTNLKADLNRTEDEIIRTAGVVEEMECGLTDDVKTKLLACFENVAWIGADGQTYYDALEDALNRSRVISSISAVFTQGSTVIYDTDELYALKQCLTVTATYSDGTTKEVNNYTLSGKLVVGTSTITVAYNKKTTTFNVTVTHQAKILESITAIFNSSASITTDNTLEDLRPYLTVRATYSDASIQTVTNYTLSGSLNVGSNTITVTYSGKTTTFVVDVTQAEKTLQSISAVFNQGSAVIYTDSSLNDLKPYLTVTARYSDSTTQSVTNYTLSGTLTEGTSTITASYGGKSATFNVTVTKTSGRTYYANYDFTESLNDKSGHGEVALSYGTEATSNAQRTSAGLVFSQPAQIAYFGEIDPIGKTFEFTISNFDFRGSTDNHIRLLMCSNGIHGMGPLIYRKDTGYNAYSFWKSDLASIDKAWGYIPWAGLQGSGTSVINSLSGKTVKIVFENSHTVALYLNDVLKSRMTDLYYNTAEGATPSGASRYNKSISFGGTTDTPSVSEGDQCYNLTLQDFKIYDNE